MQGSTKGIPLSLDPTFSGSIDAIGASQKAIHDFVTLYATVPSASYASTAISSSYSANGFPYNGNSIITGSLTITGSVKGNVVSMSIASSTASMDLSLGNFFTLTLVSGSTTYLNPTNITPGNTVNILIVPNTGSLSYPATIKFDSAYTASTSGNDVLTFISFDNTTLYGTYIKGFQ